MVHNVHRREYATSAERLGSILETLASDNDLLWPHRTWAPMILSDGLNPGSAGGHGPVRYKVEAHEPFRMVCFRFTGPHGWDGTHSFHIDAVEDGRARLTHVIDMKLHGAALVTWSLMFRPLHDALMEDALDRVARELDPAARPHTRHSTWVKFLRRMLAMLLRSKAR